MPLVRFYLDYFDGLGKLRDIYFAYRCQKAKIMPSFDKTGVAQIALIYTAVFGIPLLLRQSQDQRYWEGRLYTVFCHMIILANYSLHVTCTATATRD